MLHFGVVTLFPEMLAALRAGGVTARALAAGQVRVDAWSPREFATSRHRHVDDRPYGGGPGMVLQAPPVGAAIAAARDALGGGGGTPPLVVGLSPQGERFHQGWAARLVERGRVVLVAGRYEGMDERISARELDLELSIGDYVLSGGELPAMVVIDACARLVPGVLGHEGSARSDSFVAGILDHPHYTRPVRYRGSEVPEVLLSGDHAAIERWRLREALGRTWLRRPDLLEGLELEPRSEALLAEFIEEALGRAAGRTAPGEGAPGSGACPEASPLPSSRSPCGPDRGGGSGAAPGSGAEPGAAPRRQGPESEELESTGQAPG